MSAVAVFILFAICLVIAIPVSISLAIAYMMNGILGGMITPSPPATATIAVAKSFL